MLSTYRVAGDFVITRDSSRDHRLLQTLSIYWQGVISVYHTCSHVLAQLHMCCCNVHQYQCTSTLQPCFAAVKLVRGVSDFQMEPACCDAKSNAFFQCFANAVLLSRSLCDALQLLHMMPAHSRRWVVTMLPVNLVLFHNNGITNGITGGTII